MSRIANLPARVRTTALTVLSLVAASSIFAQGPAHAGELSASLKAEYPVSPKVVWQKIGDFSALADWHPMVKLVTVEGSGAGAVRTVTWTNGATLVEKLTDIQSVTEENDAEGWIATATVETTLSITNLASQLKVVAGPTPGSSVVTWSSTFEAQGISDEDAVALMKDYYEQGLTSLSTIVE